MNLIGGRHIQIEKKLVPAPDQYPVKSAAELPPIDELEDESPFYI